MFNLKPSDQIQNIHKLFPVNSRQHGCGSLAVPSVHYCTVRCESSTDRNTAVLRQRAGWSIYGGSPTLNTTRETRSNQSASVVKYSLAPGGRATGHAQVCRPLTTDSNIRGRLINTSCLQRESQQQGRWYYDPAQGRSL